LRTSFENSKDFSRNLRTSFKLDVGLELSATALREGLCVGRVDVSPCEVADGCSCVGRLGLLFFAEVSVGCLLKWTPVDMSTWLCNERRHDLHLPEDILLGFRDAAAGIRACMFTDAVFSFGFALLK
jgi:hypothetical protein